MQCWLKPLTHQIIKRTQTRLDSVEVNYAQLRIISKADNSFTPRSSKNKTAASCVELICNSLLKILLSVEQ